MEHAKGWKIGMVQEGKREGSIRETLAWWRAVFLQEQLLPLGTG